jgi:hypothetical protein
MGKFIFDGPTLSILGESSAVIGGEFTFTVAEIYSEWVDWVAQSDNLKYFPAFKTIGGDPIGGGQYIGNYVFIRNDLGWRLHSPNTGDVIVNIEGNFFAENSSLPFLETWAGATTTLVSRVSSMTQGIVTSGSTITPQEIAAAVRTELQPELDHTLSLSNGLTAPQLNMLLEMYSIMGLDPTKPLLVTSTSRSIPGLTQTIDTNTTRTIITRA